MRRVFLLYFLWVICLITPGLGRAERPWGAMDTFVQDEHHKYAMDSLISHRTVFYNTTDEVTPTEEAAFIQALTAWPKETLQFIKNSKHKARFKDIIPLLEGSVSFQKTSQNPDITFGIGRSQKCGPGAAGCLITTTNQPFEMFIIETYRGERFPSVTLHEMGHYYGLSDQYDHVQARYISSAEYSSDVNQKERAVMADDTVAGGHITCDDADGFINILDLRLAQYNKGKFSKRAKKGWKSLCPKNTNFYQEGRSITRKRADLLRYPKPSFMALKNTGNGQVEKGERNFEMLRTYDKGRLEAEMLVALPDRTLLFDIEKDSVVTRNKKTGLITSIKTPLSVYEIERSKAQDVYKNFTDYKPSNRQEFWTRTFSYSKVQEEYGRKLFTLSVTDSIAGIPQGQFEISIAEDGWVGGNNTPISIYKNKYTAHLPSQEWKLRFVLDKDRNMEQFFIESRDEANKLSGTAKDSSLQAVIDGESAECSATKFPTEKCEEIADYWVAYRNHLRNIKSFYQNFYDPFFNTKLDESKERKVLNDIKKGLRITEDNARPTRSSSRAGRGAAAKNSVKNTLPVNKSADRPAGQKTSHNQKRKITHL